MCAPKTSLQKRPVSQRSLCLEASILRSVECDAAAPSASLTSYQVIREQTNHTKMLYSNRNREFGQFCVPLRDR